MAADDRDGPDEDDGDGPDEDDGNGPDEDDRDGPDEEAAPVVDVEPEAAEPELEPKAEPELETRPEPQSGPEAEPVIEVIGLSYERADRRRFRRLRRNRVPIRALGDISFTIAAGEAVGCLGPKGSGKTALLEILTGMLSPTEGTVRLGGLRPETTPDELAQRVGVVFGHRPQLWPDLTLAQSLRILASIHHLPERRWLPRRTELTEQLELAAFLDSPVQLLSPGPRRRAEVAAALLHEPELLVLDEPTRDLDVRSKERLRSLLRHEHRVHRRTVLISSDDLAEVEHFCDRLLVLDHGRLAYDGSVAGLTSRAGTQRVLVVDLTEPGQLLDDVSGTSLFAIEADGLRQRLSFAPGEVSTASVLAAVTARSGIRDLTLEDLKLDDVIRQLRFHPEPPDRSTG